MHINSPARFRNCIASLFNLDRYELQSGGVIEPGKAGDNDWHQLNENAARWVLHLDDARLTALWALVEARQRRSPAIDDVAAERNRQIYIEGWTPEHDDQHVNGEMARAGAGYAYHAGLSDEQRAKGLPQGWPAGWAFSWWKPSTRRRDLVKAAALILAEIERIDRREAGQS